MCYEIKHLIILLKQSYLVQYEINNLICKNTLLDIIARYIITGQTHGIVYTTIANISGSIT